MFRRFVLVGALLAWLAPLAAAETADEVVAKFIAANGGMEKIKSVTTVKDAGSATAMPVRPV